MVLSGKSNKKLLARAARQYAEIGWQVFAEPYDEEMAQLGSYGINSASSDVDLVRDRFRDMPRSILNIRTGEVSGLVAIEIEAPIGMRTAAHLDRAGVLPQTVVVSTGGGGGYLLYRHPGVFVPSVRNGLGPGVHVHGENSGFMAPPTRNPRNGSIVTWLSGEVEKPTVELHPRVIKSVTERSRSAA